eukprot:jgi/Astpho2/5461/Aster-08000
MLPQVPDHRIQGFKTHTWSSLTFGWEDGHRWEGSRATPHGRKRAFAQICAHSSTGGGLGDSLHHHAKLDVDREWGKFVQKQRHARSDSSFASPELLPHSQQAPWDSTSTFDFVDTPSDLPAGKCPYHPEHPDNQYTPFPSFPPGGDANELQRVERWQRHQQRPLGEYNLNPHADPWSGLAEVHVILFGVDSGDAEGIYSLRALTDDDTVPTDTIVAFECLQDAERYATLLEATMSHKPDVVPISPAELREFCEDHGYNCRLEAAGTHFIPPDYNVSVTDWERSLRLRNGLWRMIGDTSPSGVQDPSVGSMQNNAGPYGSEHLSELEQAKRRLERLFDI